MVVHKPARECPVAEPHPPDTCGIVKARRQQQLTFGAPTPPVLTDDGREDEKKSE